MIILTLFKSDKNSSIGFWSLLIAYVIAKIFESYDAEIHEIMKVISGHSLKHIVASIGIYLFIKSYIKRWFDSKILQSSINNLHPKTR